MHHFEICCSNQKAKRHWRAPSNLPSGVMNRVPDFLHIHFHVHLLCIVYRHYFAIDCYLPVLPIWSVIAFIFMVNVLYFALAYDVTSIYVDLKQPISNAVSERHQRFLTTLWMESVITFTFIFNLYHIGEVFQKYLPMLSIILTIVFMSIIMSVEYHWRSLLHCVRLA